MPKLSFNSRLSLISHLKCIHTSGDFNYVPHGHPPIDNTNKNCHLCRFLLTNKNYLNSLVLNSKIQIQIKRDFCITSTLERKLDNDKSLKFTFKHSNISLILLSKVESLKLIIDQSFKWHEITSEDGKKWTKICTELKYHKTLKHIDAEIVYLKNTYAQIFLDLLHDKIKSLKICGEQNVCMDQRLNLDKLRIVDSLKDPSHTLTIKAKRIEMTKELDIFDWLLKCGNLKSNPYIEVIKLSTKFRQENYDGISLDSPNKTRLKYEKGIEILRAINPNMTLEFHNFIGFMDYLTLKDYDATVSHLNNLIGNIKLLVDVANEFKMNISLLKVKAYLLLDEWSDDFMSKLTEEFKLNIIVDPSKINDTFWYKGTQIRLNQYIEENRIITCDWEADLMVEM